MLGKKRGLLWLVLTLVPLLCAPNNLLAEEIGTTPDGNVIYMFRCPLPQPEVTYKIKFPHHMGNHPEWDLVEYQGPSVPVISTDFQGLIHGGQVLTCRFTITERGEQRGSLAYRYKVHRHIISCGPGNENRSLRCILEADGGGQSSSNIESSPVPPKKCVGLGCETQPNPGGCIGMGCGTPPLTKGQ
jgi:hypothetical protein